MFCRSLIEFGHGTEYVFVHAHLSCGKVASSHNGFRVISSFVFTSTNNLPLRGKNCPPPSHPFPSLAPFTKTPHLTFALTFVCFIFGRVPYHSRGCGFQSWPISEVVAMSPNGKVLCATRCGNVHRHGRRKLFCPVLFPFQGWQVLGWHVLVSLLHMCTPLASS